VLFVYGSLTAAPDANPTAAFLSGVLGLAAGALVGVAIYAGLARIPTRHLFAVTNVLIAVLAASIASQLVRSLAQVGFLERGTESLWDSSQLLAPDSALGTLLHALVGYDARPSAAQLTAYAGVLAFIYVATSLLQRSRQGKPRQQVARPPRDAGRRLEHDPTTSSR
jgi:high-affinity iron transporter